METREEYEKRLAEFTANIFMSPIPSPVNDNDIFDDHDIYRGLTAADFQEHLALKNRENSEVTNSDHPCSSPKLDHKPEKRQKAENMTESKEVSVKTLIRPQIELKSTRDDVEPKNKPVLEKSQKAVIHNSDAATTVDSKERTLMKFELTRDGVKSKNEPLSESSSIAVTKPKLSINSLSRSIQPQEDVSRSLAVEKAENTVDSKERPLMKVESTRDDIKSKNEPLSEKSSTTAPKKFGTTPKTMESESRSIGKAAQNSDLPTSSSSSHVSNEKSSKVAPKPNLGFGTTPRSIQPQKDVSRKLAVKKSEKPLIRPLMKVDLTEYGFRHKNEDKAFEVDQKAITVKPAPKRQESESPPIPVVERKPMVSYMPLTGLISDSDEEWNDKPSSGVDQKGSTVAPKRQSPPIPVHERKLTKMASIEKEKSLKKIETDNEKRGKPAAKIEEIRVPSRQFGKEPVVQKSDLPSSASNIHVTYLEKSPPVAPNTTKPRFSQMPSSVESQEDLNNNKQRIEPVLGDKQTEKPQNSSLEIDQKSSVSKIEEPPKKALLSEAEAKKLKNESFGAQMMTENEKVSAENAESVGQKPHFRPMFSYEVFEGLVSSSDEELDDDKSAISRPQIPQLPTNNRNSQFSRGSIPDSRSSESRYTSSPNFEEPTTNDNEIPVFTGNNYQRFVRLRIENQVGESMENRRMANGFGLENDRVVQREGKIGNNDANTVSPTAESFSSTEYHHIPIIAKECSSETASGQESPTNGMKGIISAQKTDFVLLETRKGKKVTFDRQIPEDKVASSSNTRPLACRVKNLVEGVDFESNNSLPTSEYSILTKREAYTIFYDLFSTLRDGGSLKDYFKPNYPFIVEGIIHKSVDYDNKINVYTSRLGKVLLNDSIKRQSMDYVHFLAVAPGDYRVPRFDNHPTDLRSTKFLKGDAIEVLGYAIGGASKKSNSDGAWICWNDSLGLMRIITGPAERSAMKKNPNWNMTLDVFHFTAMYEKNKFVVKKVTKLTNEHDKAKGFPECPFLLTDLVYHSQRDDDHLFHSATLKVLVHVKNALVRMDVESDTMYHGVVVPTFPGSLKLVYRAIFIDEESFWAKNPHLEETKKKLEFAAERYLVSSVVIKKPAAAGVSQPKPVVSQPILSISGASNQRPKPMPMFAAAPPSQDLVSSSDEDDWNDRPVSPPKPIQQARRPMKLPPKINK